MGQYVISFFLLVAHHHLSFIHSFIHKVKHFSSISDFFLKKKWGKKKGNAKKARIE